MMLVPGPEEVVVAGVLILVLEECSVDGIGQGRIVQLEAEVLCSILGGLHPTGSDFQVVPVDPVGRLLVVIRLYSTDVDILDAEGEGVDKADVALGLVRELELADDHDRNSWLG